MKIEQAYHVYAHKARAADTKLHELLETHGHLLSQLITLEEQMQQQRKAHEDFSTLAINTLYLEKPHARKQILNNQDFKTAK
jgi:hypothetical protein